MKNYGVRFGSGDPRTYTGLSATFLQFINMATGATVTPPSISELFAGTGIYNFQWGTTTPIAFLIDAATISPGANGRYVSGQLDPSDRSNEYGATATYLGEQNLILGTTGIYWGLQNNILSTTMTANINTLLAISMTNTAYLGAVGSTASSFGTSVTDPTDLFGYLKRVIENLEGNETYYKASGALTILSRGSSYTLANKTLANSISLVTKL